MEFHRFVVLGLATLLGACAGTPQRAEGSLSPDGVWEGSVPVCGSDTKMADLRLSLDGDVAKVWHLREGLWLEAKPGQFRVQRFMTNAVIYSTDSGRDNDGTWVESWALVVTPESPSELLVAWSRVVHNVGVNAEGGRFASQAKGILRRVQGT